MQGERDLATLLGRLQPRLYESPYVFVEAPLTAVPDRPPPFATVLEDEGATLVLEQARADALGLAYEYVAARISLGVPSALEAVGLTGMLAGALGARGISCNVIAGLRHDHLFVPFDRRHEALEVLGSLGEPAS